MIWGRRIGVLRQHPSTRSLIRSSDGKVHSCHSPTHSVSPSCVRWLTSVRGDHVICIICMITFIACVCCTLYAAYWMDALFDMHTGFMILGVWRPWYPYSQVLVSTDTHYFVVLHFLSRRLYAYLFLLVIIYYVCQLGIHWVLGSHLVITIFRLRLLRRF